ncbi:hypothetical protein Gotri_000528, partial [Gossypium trilobum]|nr:hypothetical protein [Gossypium trilobum]
QTCIHHGVARSQPHTDHGLLTLLIQNDTVGLQVLHKDKWVNIHPIPNSFLANNGDHIEILSNGKYRSFLHRAVVNHRDVRKDINSTGTWTGRRHRRESGSNVAGR